MHYSLCVDSSASDVELKYPSSARFDDVRTRAVVVGAGVAERASNLNILPAKRSLVLHVQASLEPAGINTDEPTSAGEDLDADPAHVATHVSGCGVEHVVQSAVIKSQKRTTEHAHQGIAIEMLRTAL